MAMVITIIIVIRTERTKLLQQEGLGGGGLVGVSWETSV